MLHHPVSCKFVRARDSSAGMRVPQSAGVGGIELKYKISGKMKLDQMPRKYKAARQAPRAMPRAVVPDVSVVDQRVNITPSFRGAGLQRHI